MKRETAVHRGKKGYYAIEFFGVDGTVEAKASGPIPFEGVGWTSIVATVTAETREQAFRLVVEELEARGF